MTQTIALQSGEVTMTNNTETLVFTNTASGTATRMVVGLLSFHDVTPTGNTYGYCSWAVLRDGASAPDYSEFAGTKPGQPSHAQTLLPFESAQGFFTTDTSAYQNTTVFYSADATSELQDYSNKSNSSGPRAGWYRDNVIIGPSDKIYCAWKDNGGNNNTAVFQYSFTLITES